MKKYIGIALSVAILLVTGCKSEFDKYYEVDDALQETIYEYLDKAGEYTIFLEALQIAGYDNILSSSGLFTVLAVKDSDFNTYLSNHSYSSISNIPEDELYALISYHILDWPFSQHNITHGFYDEETPEDPLMFKKRTRSVKPVETITGINDRSYPVVHENKMMSFFSKGMLEANNADITDLKYFYPIISGDLIQSGMIYAGNAQITEGDIPVLNGWIHIVDAIIPPPLNHYEYLKTKDNYSLFFDMAFSQAKFKEDEKYRELNSGLGYDTIFLLDMYNFDTEYIGKSDNHLEQSSSQREVQKQVISSFIPTNEALQNFLDEHFSLYPNPPEDFPEIVINQIISSGLFEEMVLPSKLFSNELINTFGRPFIYNEADIDEYTYTSNGPLYGVNTFRVPDEFGTVLRPLLTDPNYSIFLAGLAYTDLYSLLVADSSDLNYTVMPFSNTAWMRSGFQYDPDIPQFYQFGVIIKKADLKTMLSAHIIKGTTELDSDELFFVETVNGDYIGYDNGIIWGGENFTFPEIQTKYTEGNGLVYEIDGVITPSETGLQKELSSNTECSEFYTLLEEAGLIVGDNITMLQKQKYTCFVPSNTIIEDAKTNGLIPTETDELINFLKYYFIETETYDDARKTGDFKTLQEDPEQSTAFNKVYRSLHLSGTPQSMLITGFDGSTANYLTSNIMTKDGSVHIIDNLLYQLN